MVELLDQILKMLKQSEPVTLATVVQHSGSTPRGAGTRFIIRQDGTTMGTIGGGLVEAEVIEAAKTVFASRAAIIHHHDMTQQHLTSKSMICGGDMTVLIELLSPSEDALEFYQSLHHAYQNRKQSLFVIKMDSRGGNGCNTTHTLINKNGEHLAGSVLENDVIEQLKNGVFKQSTPVMINTEAAEYWVESLVFPNRLYLFGAGHVSRPTARLGATTGFQTMVVDDRADLLSRQYFDESVELVFVDSFENCLEKIPVDPDSFLVILTRGHTFDRMVLSQALRTEAMYIGMIGSKRKRNAIFNHLLEEGFTQLDLDRVHSPIGLAIGAETPEEIAISIVAELISTRANHR
ncbi:XdhC family protein [bacterium]|nr:XdhC family protein [bacterium]